MCPIPLPVIRSHDLRERVVASEDHVAALLPSQRETDPCQSSCAFPPRDGGQTGHTATTNVSKRSAGTGRLSASSVATYPRMASRMFAMASSLFAP